MAGYLDNILKKTAAASTNGKYPFLPEGNHRKMTVKNLFVLVGGHNGDTAILEVLVEESSNPEAEGQIFCSINPLQGPNKDVSYGNLKGQAQAIAASLKGSRLDADLSVSEMSELGIIGVKRGPNAPDDLKEAASEALGTPIQSNSVRVLKKGAKLPFTDDNSYVRHNWAPCFKKPVPATT